MDKILRAVARTAELTVGHDEIRPIAMAEIERIVATFPSDDEAWRAILLAALVSFIDRLDAVEASAEAERRSMRSREIREAILGRRDPKTVSPLK